jgi:soluble lytic murein transglycosylase
MDSRGGLKFAVLVAVTVTVIGCSTQPKASPLPPPPPPPAAATELPQTVSGEIVTTFSPREEARFALHGGDPLQLKSAAERNPLVAPFIRLRMLDIVDSREAVALATEIAATNTSAATVAKLRLPALHARNEDAAATETTLAEAMQVPIDELTESDFVDLAKRLAAAGRADLATKVRMHLLSNYTSGRFTEQTYGNLGAHLDTLSLDETMALAGKLSRANRYDQALDLFDRIARRFPDAQTRDQYRAVRVRALFNSRNYSTLLEETRDVKLEAPLALLRARAAWRNEKPDEFLAGVAAVEKDFPGSREAAEGKVMRARYYSSDETDYPRAIDNLAKAIDAGVVGSDGENLWNLGWLHVLSGKHEEALAIFDRYIRTYPDGDYKTNSLFWSAKVLDHLGRGNERDAKARQLVAEYPFSYYAYRTKELWPQAADAPAPAKAFPDLAAESLDDPRIAVVTELLEIGMAREAAREMKTIAAQYPDNNAVQFMLADVYVRGGEPFKANGILQRRFREFVRHGGANIPPSFWQILFPLPYLDVIRAEAAKRNLDPYLVASVIRQESGFEPTTVSNAGAVGLMQIMPHEAADIASAGGIENVTREALFDPATNIAVGTAELSQKIARMNGNETLAIAAYNAGEEPVNRWLGRTPLDDVDVFIESIPYAETRLYVKTVTRNRHEYARIYGKS